MHAGIRLRRPALVRALAGLAAGPAPAGGGGVGHAELQRRHARRAARGAGPASRWSWSSPTSRTSRRGSGSSRGSTAWWWAPTRPAEQALAHRDPGGEASPASRGWSCTPASTARGGPGARERVRERSWASGAEDFTVTPPLRGQGLAGDGAARRARLLEADPGWTRDRALRRQPRPPRAPRPARGPPRRAACAGSGSPTGWRSSWPRATCSSPSPGPGSLAEAFHQQVPVVVTRNLPHDPAGALQHRLRGATTASGSWSPHWREIPAAVAAPLARPAERGRRCGAPRRAAAQPGGLRGPRGDRRGIGRAAAPIMTR